MDSTSQPEASRMQGQTPHLPHWIGRVMAKKPPLRKPSPGLAHCGPRTPKCTFEGPGTSNTTKIPRKDPREGRKNEFCGGRGEKHAKFLVPHLLGPPPFWAPHPSGLPTLGSGLPTLRGTTLCRPNIQHPKLAEVEIGPSRNWSKSKKKAGRSRNWPKSPFLAIVVLARPIVAKPILAQSIFGVIGP